LVPNLHDPSLDDECRAVAAEVEAYLDGLPTNLRAIWRRDPRTSRRGPGMAVYLPFWLESALGDGRLRHEARRMAVANRHGQLFCLLRDGILDQDADASPELLLPLDDLFLRFVRGYQGLFPADHPFWGRFEEYWQEYLEALAREKLRHARPRSYDDDDFLWLGRKFSPIKICAAGMVFAARRPGALARLEAALETFHVGYQLLDDLRDWREDLRHESWTWPLTLARREVAGSSRAEDMEKVLGPDGIATEVVEKATDHLEESLSILGDLELPVLKDWVRRTVGRVRDWARSSRLPEGCRETGHSGAGRPSTEPT
jgi:hypothetical protein